MKDLKTFRLEVWTDGQRDMCAIRADREEGAKGLRWIWFVLSRQELQDLVAGRQHTAEDGYHKVAIMGDTWTFYDFEMSSAKCGEMKVPFYAAEIPRTFAKLLVRVARWIWKQQRAYLGERTYADKVYLEFSAEYRARIQRLYGFGKGRVRWDMDPETAALVESRKEVDGAKFIERLDRIACIARNTTRGFHQAASVSLARERDGDFYWCARDTRGRAIMNGGLVNHEKNGPADWMLHT